MASSQRLWYRHRTVSLYWDDQHEPVVPTEIKQNIASSEDILVYAWMTAPFTASNEMGAAPLLCPQELSNTFYVPHRKTLMPYIITFNTWIASKLNTSNVNNVLVRYKSSAFSGWQNWLDYEVPPSNIIFNFYAMFKS